MQMSSLWCYLPIFHSIQFLKYLEKREERVERVERDREKERKRKKKLTRNIPLNSVFKISSADWYFDNEISNSNANSKFNRSVYGKAGFKDLAYLTLTLCLCLCLCLCVWFCYLSFVLQLFWLLFIQIE